MLGNLSQNSGCPDAWYNVVLLRGFGCSGARGGARGQGVGKWLQKWRLLIWHEILTKATTNYERLVPGGICQNRTTGLCKKNANKFH